jgi:hypothetical protein
MHWWQINYKQMKKTAYLFIGLLSTFFSFSQTYTLSGNTYYDRCESFISVMNTTNPIGVNSDPKYVGPYFFSRLYKNYDVANTNIQLINMYDKYLNDPSLYYNSTGSGPQFYPHATMHGYLLTKDKMTDALKVKIKSFLQLCDFNSRGGTLNLDMMINTSGFLAAEEWPDFTDKNGRNVSQIKAFTRPIILANLDKFFHQNCEELDAFTYYPTNLMYVRMLAEFAKDAEVKQKAYLAYQQMISGIVGSWNKGLYVNNPPRSKSWENLFTGSYASNTSLTAFGWVLFGSIEGFYKMIPSLTVTYNNASSVFWMTYRRTVDPIPELFEAEKLKTYPCIYQSVIQQSDNYKSRYSYQSDNYGLCTQHEELINYSNWNSSYTWKETKRSILVWRSTVDECVFSVCQDNPERPTDNVNVNIPGYGENPFQRVLQYKKAAVGVYNVPTTYNNNGDHLYRIFVPFSRTGIKQRMESNGWVLCHTGNMMFAFKTIEPYAWTTTRYQITNHDILTLADTTIRKGAWVLETTEITTALKGTGYIDELNKYLTLLNQKTSISTVNYTTDSPRVKYTSADGDLLDITYFSPSTALNGQYQVNAKLLPINLNSLAYGSTVSQQLNSDYLYIICNAGTKLINWNDTTFYTGISQTVTDVDQIYPNPIQQYLNIRNSAEYSNFRILNLSGRLLKTGNLVNENKISMIDIDKGIYLLTLVGNTKSKTIKIIKN